MIQSGVKKSRLHIAEWVNNVAPSDALSGGFGHDSAKWEGLRRQYFP
jgi:uncharacterized protein YeaO (DUF488 family)